MLEKTEELNKFIGKLQSFNGILKLNGEEVIYWNADDEEKGRELKDWFIDIKIVIPMS